MPRNPAWTRDELILALDLYFRVNPSHSSQDHPEIVRLSRVLNALPVHSDRPDRAVFRNPNGVYMKLCNFLRFDPSYNGVGLTGGGKQEKVVWDEFVADRVHLREIAAAIRTGSRTVNHSDVAKAVGPPEEAFPEGSILATIHKLRERNPLVVRKKKQAVLDATGHLECEVCSFDFERRYGDLGAGYAECHHKLPLSELTARTATSLQNLAIVCPNCHRMLHRSRPMLTIEGLRAKLR